MAKAQSAPKEEAQAPVVTPVVNVAPAEPTSEKLVEIRGKIDAAYDKLGELKGDRKAMKDQNLVIYNLEKEETAEIAAIKKAAWDAEALEKRNKRIQLATNFEDAIRASVNFENSTDHSAPDYMEKSNALNDAVKAAREIVQNELLAKYASSTPSKSVATGDTAKAGGQKGATGKAILDMFLANRVAGMTDAENKKAIVESGHAVGTVGQVVLAYQVSIGEKTSKQNF